MLSARSLSCHRTYSPRGSSIESWLDNQPSSFEDYACPDDARQEHIGNDNKTRQVEHQGTRKRRKLAKISSNYMDSSTRDRARKRIRKTALNWPEPEQEPEEEQQRAQGEDGRGVGQSEAVDTLAHATPTTPNLSRILPAFHDQDPTPRPHASIIMVQVDNSSPYASSRLPPSPTRSNTSSLSHSSTSQQTSSRGSTSKKRTRSPTKRMGDFQLSDTWVQIKAINTWDNPIPPGAVQLCLDLRRIGTCNGIIPFDIKDRAAEYIKDFRMSDANFKAEDSETAAPVSKEGKGSFFARNLSTVWNLVVEISEAAAECLDDSLPESSWNTEVHSRVLQLALRGHWRCRGIWYLSKMVDYTLLIKPDENFTRRITAKLRTEGRPSINHSMAEHLRFSPIAISIETKRAAIGEEDAHVQLAMWVAAHFARLRQLTATVTADAKAPNDRPSHPPNLPILPVVVVQGHDWKLMIAEAVSPHRVKILRDTRLGSTDSPLGIYRLMAEIRRLARWVDEEYRPWFMREVLGEDGEGGAMGEGLLVDGCVG